MAWKNSITSGGVGAAPTFTDSTWSRPSRSRIFESTSASAFSYSSPTSSPRARRRPTLSAHCVACLRSASCSASMPASIAAFSFSQMRGTAKNQLGCTSGRYAATWRGSGQQVVEKPTNIGR